MPAPGNGTHVNESTLVTVNVKDFARFKDIEVENWAKRRR
jgi:predicted nucleic acid-binding protein